jgi:hypothetical protein
MQKLSETVYSSLFWLISSLFVWLVILPVVFIGWPLAILIKIIGQSFFQLPQSNLTIADTKAQTQSDNQTNPLGESVLKLLLLSTLIEVPALLAAVISLQPKRFINSEQATTHQMGSQAKSSPEIIEMSPEEKTSGT